MAVNGIGQTHLTHTEHANTQTPSRAQSGGAKAAAPNGTVKRSEENQTHAAPTPAALIACPNDLEADGFILSFPIQN